MPTRRAPPPTLLLTGFEPFGGDAINPSAEVVQRLHGQPLEVAGVVWQVHGVVLPCTFEGSAAQLQAALAATRARAVLCTGLAAGRRAFGLERVAINLNDARIADNAGAQPLDAAVVPGGPTAYFATLPVRRIVQALRQAGLPAEVSYSAGTFVCNHVFYALMHALRRRPRVPGGFMHLPALPEMAPPGLPGLALAAQLQAVQLALAEAAAGGPDLAASAGTLD
jgi:pyroglutamyl-peptidase